MGRTNTERFTPEVALIPRFAGRRLAFNFDYEPRRSQALDLGPAERR